MSTEEASRTNRDVLHEIAMAHGAPVTAADSDEIVAMAMAPRDATGDATTEWTMLDRAVHAMEARDWPAVIVPVSGASLAAPSFAYRVRDLLEQHRLLTDRVWLEIASAESAIEFAGVVRSLADRHTVGCRIPIDDALGQRSLLPELMAMGVSFAWLQPGNAQSVADDLSALIGGRSLIRRARVHGISVIGPPDLAPDMVPPSST